MSGKPKKTEELCPACYKVVSVPSRYKMVYLLAQETKGMTVKQITDEMNLAQPTVTHHLNVLRSVDAVFSEDKGRERIYTINKQAHCFEDCNIPFK